MSQWEQWFKHFTIGWFEGLISGIRPLDDRKRNEFIFAIKEIETTTETLSKIITTWKKLDETNDSEQTFLKSLEVIPELDNETQTFLKGFFLQIFNRLELVDQESRKQILKYSGQKCAEMHALGLFKTTWDEVDNLESFLQMLNDKMGDGFRWISKMQIYSDD